MKEMKGLSEMAFISLKDGKIVFMEKDLNDMGIENSDDILNISLFTI